MAFDYDWVIVGSGFGGSVSALRLSEKGYKVAVVEVGRRFEDKDVQQEIVEELAKQKGMEQERRLVLRNHRNLYIYPFDLFDR